MWISEEKCFVTIARPITYFVVFALPVEAEPESLDYTCPHRSRQLRAGARFRTFVIGSQ